MKNYNVIHYLNKLSKNFLLFVSLLFIINFEKSLSFFPIFKTATPSLISVVIYICIVKLYIKPSYFILFLIGLINDITIGGNLGNTSLFLLLTKFFTESLFFTNVLKNNHQDWISFTMIFLSSFIIIFFLNSLIYLSIPDLSPIFYYVGTSLIIFPIIDLSVDFIAFITKLLKS
tara:strand:+ start:609 stop:1130 length:522 start_codon:yes stop_codon:yes gene_type:complete